MMMDGNNTTNNNNDNNDLRILRVWTQWFRRWWYKIKSVRVRQTFPSSKNRRIRCWNGNKKTISFGHFNGSLFVKWCIFIFLISTVKTRRIKIHKDEIASWKPNKRREDLIDQIQMDHNGPIKCVHTHYLSLPLSLSHSSRTSQVKRCRKSSHLQPIWLSSCCCCCRMQCEIESNFALTVVAVPLIHFVKCLSVCVAKFESPPANLHNTMGFRLALFGSLCHSTQLERSQCR